jgi:hypothetical protein
MKSIFAEIHALRLLRSLVPYNRALMMPVRWVRGAVGAAIIAFVAAGGVAVRGQNPAGRGQGPAPAQAPATGTAFLAGQVIDDASGRPVPDAVVRITIASPSLSGNLMFAPMANRGAVATDSQGRYVFGSLPAGSYSPRATKNGYAPASVVATRAITLADGEHILDLNIHLARLGTISGTLRDDAGDPVVGTDVIVLRRTLANGRPTLRPSGQGTSDDRGQYRVTALTAGDYLLCACSRRAIPFDAVLLTTLAADPTQLLGVASRAISVGADVAQLDNTMRTFTTVAGATRVSLGAGDDKTGVDFELTPTVATRVSGTVTGGVSPMLASQIRLSPAGESENAVAITDLPAMLVQPDGRFDFSGVPPGQYMIRVTHLVTGARTGSPTGEALSLLGARAVPPPGAVPGPDDYQTWASTPITVGPDGARGIVVTLRPAIRINGRMQFVGSTRQPTAQELTRVNLLLQSLAPQPGQGALTFGRVNGDGTFQIPTVLPGRYFFNTSLIANWTTLKSITLRDQDVTDLPLDVSDTDPGELVFTFTDAPMSTLAGQGAPSTMGAASRRSEDMTALVFPSDTRFWADPGAALRRFRSVPVTREGSFPPIPLPVGEYFVAIVPDARAVDWQERSQLEALAKTAEKVRIVDGDHKVLEIRR